MLKRVIFIIVVIALVLITFSFKTFMLNKKEVRLDVLTEQTKLHAPQREERLPAFLGTPRHFHCGLMSRKSPMKFAVPLKNNLVKSIVIRGSNVSCGCVSVIELPKSIPAGETAYLWFVLDASRSIGVIRQQILVFTDNDDPARSLYKIGITASVKGLWFEPSTLAFGRINTSHLIKKSFVISAIGYKRLHLKSVTCDNQNFQIDAGECRRTEADIVSDDGDTGETQYDQILEVSLKSKSLIGRITGTITAIFETEDGDIDVSSLVNAEVSGSVECVPSHVLWSKVAPGEMLVGHAIIKSNNDIDMSRLSLTGEPSTDFNITASIIESTASETRIRIDLICPNAVPTQILRGKIIGRVDGQQVFELPVTALVIRSD